MAVAAGLGGVSPNFDVLYKETARLAKKLSIASPREINDPGQTLQLTKGAINGNPPEIYDTYMRAFYKKEGDPITYQLFYKDANNQEQMISDGTNIMAGFATPSATVPAYSLNGKTIITGNALRLDPEDGRITFDKGGTAEEVLGLMKLDGATGIDIALINDRISQVNLVIEALNKVLIVASGNVDKSVELRL